MLAKYEYRAEARRQRIANEAKALEAKRAKGRRIIADEAKASGQICPARVRQFAAHCDSIQRRAIEVRNQIAAIDKPTPKRLARSVQVLSRGGSQTFELLGEVTPQTARDFRRALENADGKPVTVVIDSEGGCALSAATIHDLIRSYVGPTTAVVHSALSAASFVASACDHVGMHRSGFWMAHDSFIDNDEPTASQNDLLAKLNRQMLVSYCSRGADPSRVQQAMESETFWTAEEARRMRLIDEVLG